MGTINKPFLVSKVEYSEERRPDSVRLESTIVLFITYYPMFETTMNKGPYGQPKLILIHGQAGYHIKLHGAQSKRDRI